MPLANPQRSLYATEDEDALRINLWETTVALDPILSEVWRIREEYARQFNGDLRAMMDDLRRRHAESSRKSVIRQHKPIKPTR